MGQKRLLIIAQDSTSYGWDLKEKVYLNDLINQLNKIKDIDWIRIHYAHPAHLSNKIIESMANAEKVCNYLDMPVQHASDNMLNKMRRGLGNKGIVKKINSLRECIPNIALRTTLIVGHPGETNHDFKLLKEFVEQIQFDRLGVFAYSEEDGTLAANYNDDVSFKRN